MIKIAIDAGHGFNTAGKRTPPMHIDVDFEKDGKVDVKKGQAIREHVANVGVAVELDKELKRCGINTVKVGWNDANPNDDIDTPLAERQRAVAQSACDYSVSIHFNAHGDGAVFTPAEGIEVLIHNLHVGQSRRLAELTLKHLVQGTKQVNRGVKQQALAMCNCSVLKVKAAILVELGFMTNKREAELMGSQAFWKECAKEIAQGICEFAGIKYIPETLTLITRDSDKSEIAWLQNRLNQCVTGYKIPVTSIYDSATRIAVLMYWRQLGWGEHLRDDGTEVGKATIKALSEGRTK